MTQNSACIVEVAANDAEMEYGPKLNGGFLTPEKARDDDCWMQYGFCICCGPICFPLSLVNSAVGWLCFPIGIFVHDEHDEQSMRSRVANYVCCYQSRWSFCAMFYLCCPCFNLKIQDFYRKFPSEEESSVAKFLAESFNGTKKSIAIAFPRISITMV
eukprot:jgi/Bigna1/142011/aug1.66_g16719